MSKFVEVEIQCTGCHYVGKKTVDATLTDRDIVQVYREDGWTCAPNGSRARCPRCVRGENSE